MAIKEHIIKGEKHYEVSINVRSQVNPKIRKQKRKTGITSKAKAQRIERDLRRQAYLEITSIDGEGFLWSQIVDKWEVYKRIDKYEPIGKQTLEDYIASLKKWTLPFWNKPAKQINRADIKSLLRELEDNGLSKSFQSKLKGIINRIFNWGIEEELIKGVSQSPTWGINVSRKSERVPTILNKQEIFRLLRVAKQQNHKWYPIWATALLTGCRNGELFALVWDDINFLDNTIRVSKSYNKRLNITKSTKAGYWRNVPINEDLKSLLLCLKKDSKTQYVLPRLREWKEGYQAKVLRNFCSSIGITEIRFHDLRACFATQLLQNKVPPATLMKICGWKDLDTMGKYIRLAGIDESGATDSLSILPNTDNLIALTR